jgi:hypothetical protein
LITLCPADISLVKGDKVEIASLEADERRLAKTEGFFNNLT